MPRILPISLASFGLLFSTILHASDAHAAACARCAFQLATRRASTAAWTTQPGTVRRSTKTFISINPAMAHRLPAPCGPACNCWSTMARWCSAGSVALIFFGRVGIRHVGLSSRFDTTCCGQNSRILLNATDPLSDVLHFRSGDGPQTTLDSTGRRNVGHRRLSPLARTPSHGRTSVLVPKPTTPSLRPRSNLAGKSGRGGMANTGAAPSRPRCVASSCLVSASWRATSTARSPDYRSVPLS